jgi:hypothetical protein
MMIRRKKLFLFWMIGLCIALPGPAYSDQICKIRSPKRLAKLYHFPVEIVVELGEGTRPETFQASFNDTNITSRFEQIKGGVRAFVGPEDGLRVSDRKDTREKINIFRATVKGPEPGQEAGLETFFFVAVDSLDVIGVEGGVIQSADGEVSVHVPKRALFSQTTLGLAKVPSAFGEMGAVYELSPQDMRFNYPVTMAMKFDPGDLPEEVRAEDLFLILDDGLPKRPENIRVDKVENTVTGTSTYLSRVFMSHYVDTGKNLQDIPRAAEFRLPIGDDSDPPYSCGKDYQLPSDQDLGEVVGLLRRRAYPNFDYPEIRFNEQGRTNQWHVVKAFNEKRYIYFEEGSSRGGKSLHFKDEENFSNGETWVYQGPRTEDQDLPIHAIADGLIVYNGPGMGNTLVLAHEIPAGPVFSIYSYEGEKSPCAVGTMVRKGNVIAKIQDREDGPRRMHYAIGRPSAVKVDSQTGDLKVAAHWFMEWKQDVVYARYYDPTDFLLNIAGKYQWGFDIDGDAGGWVVKDVREMEKGRLLRVKEGMLSLRPAPKDSLIESYPLKLDAGGFDSVFLGMRSNALYGYGKVYFATDNDPVYSEDKAVSFAMVNDGALHGYRVFMADNAGWEGTIVGLRIAFLNTAVEENTEIDFDFIRLGRAYLSRIPDSGQSSCYDTMEKIACPDPEGSFYGQDAHYTINVPHFEVKRVDSHEIVEDHITGLAWQRHDDGVKRTWREAKAYCENMTLGGYSDWRLPTKKELKGILDYGAFRPVVDTAYFAYSHPSDASYWSSTTRISHTVSAWKVSFWDGQAHLSQEGEQNYVRAARGRPLEFGHFRDNGNGTVTDTTTGLVWYQGETTAMDWEEALIFCEKLDLAGQSDWRLPNIRELSSLVQEGQGRAIDTAFFPGCRPSAYWSSTTHSGFPSFAWHVDFKGDGGQESSNKERENYVRAVRGGRHSEYVDYGM